MEHKAEKTQPNDISEPKVFVLPLQIISQSDLSRVTREMEEVDDFFTQASLKAASAKSVPQISLQLSGLFEENSLNLLQKQDRRQLKQFLEVLRAKAPVVTASFATDPKTDFLMKLVGWFRTEAHPYVLLQTGLQPNIAAGCIFRTTNKYFDFSFKEHFKKSKLKLSESLRTTE